MGPAMKSFGTAVIDRNHRLNLQINWDIVTLINKNYLQWQHSFMFAGYGGSDWLKWWTDLVAEFTDW